MSGTHHKNNINPYSRLYIKFSTLLFCTGMPRGQDDSSSKGKLLIKFQVDFPQSHFAKEEALKRLQSLLPLAPPTQALPANVEAEHVSLSDFDPAELRQKKGGASGGGRRGEAYDEDEEDDEASAPRGPQCAAQ